MTDDERGPALIGFDGSEPAAEAIRAAAAVMPGSAAVIAHVRGMPLRWEDGSAARVALPDEVIVKALRAHEAAAVAAAREAVDRGVAIAREAGLDATPAVIASNAPWRGLCAGAGEHGARVIVCGTRGLGGVSRAFLGSTSSSLLYRSPLPVLVVPAGGGPHDGPIVIGYDGSDGAREAVAAAARLFPGRAAIVVHGWTSPVRRSFTGESVLAAPLDEIGEVASSLDEMLAGDAEELAEEGASLAREHGVEARGLAVEGPPNKWRALIDAAGAEHAALIVTGSRGRGPLASNVLGSVSAGLVHNADVPVLVARAG